MVGAERRFGAENATKYEQRERIPLQMECVLSQHLKEAHRIGDPSNSKPEFAPSVPSRRCRAWGYRASFLLETDWRGPADGLARTDHRHARGSRGSEHSLSGSFAVSPLGTRRSHQNFPPRESRVACRWSSVRSDGRKQKRRVQRYGSAWLLWARSIFGEGKEPADAEHSNDRAEQHWPARSILQRPFGFFTSGSRPRLSYRNCIRWRF
jgi:hypothetical protein